MQTEAFIAILEKGQLLLPGTGKNFSQVNWSDHPTFAGVSLKHLVTAADTEGQFSYHLVKILPGQKIGQHLHKGQLETHEVLAGHGFCLNAGTKLSYQPGVITIFPADTLHEVHAGQAGLFLLAKFFPALC